MDFGFDEFAIDILKQYWYWIVLFFVFKLFLEEILPFLLKNWKFKKILAWNDGQEKLRELRKLSPEDFELFIVDLFEKLGYYVTHNGKSGDHGIDVVAEKNGIKTYIQCKKYGLSHKVGEPDIRNFLGSLMDRRIETNGIFITTSSFTFAAQKFAEDKPLDLVNGFELLKYIKLSENNNSAVEELKCPKCGQGNLVEREGKYGKFIGCTLFPKCRYISKVKS